MESIFIPREEDFRKWIREELQSILLAVNNTKTTEPVEEEPLLSRSEIQRIFGISKMTIYNWTKDDLPHYRKKRRVYFLRSEVLEYMAKNKSKSIF